MSDFVKEAIRLQLEDLLEQLKTTPIEEVAEKMAQQLAPSTGSIHAHEKLISSMMSLCPSPDLDEKYQNKTIILLIEDEEGFGVYAKGLSSTHDIVYTLMHFIQTTGYHPDERDEDIESVGKTIN